MAIAANRLRVVPRIRAALSACVRTRRLSRAVSVAGFVMAMTDYLPWLVHADVNARVESWGGPEVTDLREGEEILYRVGHLEMVGFGSPHESSGYPMSGDLQAMG